MGSVGQNQRMSVCSSPDFYTSSCGFILSILYLPVNTGPEFKAKSRGFQSGLGDQGYSRLQGKE